MPDPRPTAILDWVEQRILSFEEFFIPLMRLCREIPPELADPPPAPEVLRSWIETDPRFEILRPSAEPGDGGDAESAEEEEEMERLGYFKGPRVGLKNKRPSREEVLKIIQKHAGKLVEALQKAYAARPRGGGSSAEIEDQLLDLMQRAQTLQKHLPGSGGKNGRSTGTGNRPGGEANAGATGGAGQPST